MLKIKRWDEPDFWMEYKRKNPRHSYKDLNNSDDGVSTRKALHQYLIKSQGYLCAYCCISISTKSSLNEHIRPQNGTGYEQYSMDYDNLIVSCCSSDTCSNKKGSAFDEGLFVSPLDPDCNTHFKFYPNGEIEGTDEKGRYTCELLNLNSYRLKQLRKATYKSCCAYNDDGFVLSEYLTAHDGKFESFYDMVEYFYNLKHFSVSI